MSGGGAVRAKGAEEGAAAAEGAVSSSARRRRRRIRARLNKSSPTPPEVDDGGVEGLARYAWDAASPVALAGEGEDVHVVATRDVHKGELIFSETPYACVVVDGEAAARCSVCLKTRER